MMHHNILFNFKGRPCSNICTIIRENCKYFFVEICSAQMMPVNIVIFLIFSYSLNSPKLFISVPTMRIMM